MQEIRRQKFGSHATMSLWMFSESITCMTLTLSGTFFGGATFSVYGSSFFSHCQKFFKYLKFLLFAILASYTFILKKRKRDMQKHLGKNIWEYKPKKNKKSYSLKNQQQNNIGLKRELVLVLFQEVISKKIADSQIYGKLEFYQTAECLEQKIFNGTKPLNGPHSLAHVS